MTQKPIILKILSPDGTVFEGGADAVYLPGSAGRFEVLPSHAPLLTSLTEGEIRWRGEGGEQSLRVKGGALMLKDNIMSICAEPES